MAPEEASGGPLDESPDETDEGPDGTPDEESEPVEIDIPVLPSDLDRAAVLAFLRSGELQPLGRLVTSSNFTLLCRIVGSDAGGRPLEAACVYKPIRGEAPLWDFPDGTLAFREVAAYAVSEAAGWNIVPPTVLRDGPFGEGMVQLWLAVDETVDVVDLVNRGDAGLRRLAVFDAVVNNADRKAGHLLPMADGTIHGVDHGVCFAVEPKLRTVLWGCMEEPLREDERAILRSLRGKLDGELGRELGRRLSARELARTAGRIDELLAIGRLPEPIPGRPALPWPWY